ncbi:MAG: DUF4160 domain-containing protein [Deltaproteobacteria bacterium]|nr:DUF4160 domain-containing protein [Deltaproteobacteria bacterium]
MPTIFIHEGYRFFFFSNEGYPLKPPHVHVRRDKSVAKFWLEPDVRLAESFKMTLREIRYLTHLIERNKELIKKAWNDHVRD